MENKKKEFTLEELKEQYKALGEKIAKQEKAEAEEREAKLVAEKAARKKEIESAEENYRRLLGAYIKDYGSYSATRSCMSDDDIFTHLYRIFR
jgi:hypothetical protein